MKKAVKRIFAGLLALALVLGSSSFSGSALAAGSKKVNGTFKMGTSCYDWGEAITSVVVDLKSEVDAKSVSAKDFKFTNDYSYFDYGVYANVEGTVEREVESVSVSGSKVTLNLKTVNNSQFLLTEMAEKTAKVELVSKVTVGGTAVDKKSTFTFKGTTNAIVDEFLDLETENLTYRLFVPKKLTGKNPLFVWIHGAGESGNNNRAQIVGNMVTNWAKDDAQAILDNAFILAPQYDGDRAVAGSWGHNPAWIMEAIQKTLREYDIDENRIYVGGCSMGGAGTVNMLKNYPNFFAAAFPICAAGELTDEDCAKIAAPAAKGKKTTAIYLIHCIEDNTCNPNATFHMYSRLMNAYKALGVKESKAPVYAALFSECDYDGLMDGLQPYMSHFSWVYPQHNFDGLGDDYDGKNFISSNDKKDWYVKRDGESYDWCVEDGVIKFKDIVVTKATYDGEDVTSNYGWLPYQLPDYDESKLVKETKEEILTIKTVRPSEIGKGYADFLTWISAQSLEKTFKVSAKAASGSHKLTWSEVNGAKKYVVFGGKKGSALVKLGTVSSAKFTNKKVSGAYEYVVYAYAKNANGKWERIGKSAKVSVK